MKKWISASILLLTACSADFSSTNTKDIINIAGVKFVEQVIKRNDETVIPYSKYKLENGLTVILHEDKSDPLVHVDVTYHVGSAREEPGKSGFAHFFEHMMFQGSEHVADEQHFKIVTEAGGNMNGTTSADRTNYFQTVPANQLEKILWLESDRMGYLLDAVTQEKFEIQREAVKNERGQRVDNVPYGLISERVAEALYPESHPYSWQTIGYIDDLNRVNVNDLKAFFLRWYGPNNATLTIGGDINKAETLALVKKYFQDIKPGPAVEKPTAPSVVLAEDRYISFEDNVHLPLIYITYPTVKARHEDEAPLDLLSTILGGGKTSLFYKNLVKKQIAVQASVSHPCQELACNFSLYALPHPAAGKSLSDIEAIIRDTLVEFENRGVEDDDLIKAKASMEASFVFGLQSVAGKVSTLARNETFNNNPNYIAKDIERYSTITKADVMRVYQQYIKGQKAVILSVVPKGQQAMVAAPDNFTPPKRNFTELSTTKLSDLLLRKSEETFDRSVMPKAQANKAVELPVYSKHSMQNGIDMLAAQSIETPTTSILLKIPAGHYYESPDKAGLAALTSIMFGESTMKRTAEAMSNELRKLGSSVSFHASNYYIEININTLTKNLDKTLALTYEKLMFPAFLAQEFERVKRNNIQSLINNAKNPNFIARESFRQLMHSNSIAQVGIGGSVSGNNNVTVEDVKKFYKRFIKPANAKLIVVSDLPKDKVIKSLNIFEQWQGKGEETTFDFPIPNYKKGSIYLVNQDNAAQSVISIGKRSLTYDIAGEFYQTLLMNFALGGAFNSRLNLNLREDKGYSYGAGSSFYADKYTGQFIANAQVRADVTDKALVEMVKEIKQFSKQGITSEELSFMRKAINQQDALKYETPRAKMGYLAQILEHDLPPDFVAKRNAIVEHISQKEINALAKKHLNLDDMIILIVGDANVLKPQLTNLGYNVIDYTFEQ